MAHPNPTGIAKVLVVGDVATGKTSVIKRYVRNTFSRDYVTTIGVDFALKRVKVDDVDLNVQLWDIAGQEMFTGLSRIFYTHAVAAIIVYDLFQPDTFQSAANWKKDIDAKVFLPSGNKIPVLLLGNKDDLLEEKNGDGRQPDPQDPSAKRSGAIPVSDEEIQRFVKEHNFFAHFKCSAKTGHNIRQACANLVSVIAENSRTERPRDETLTTKPGDATTESKIVQLSSDPRTSGKEPGGCCG